MRFIKITVFLILIHVSSCVHHKTQSTVEVYFTKMKWDYPVHVSKENLQFDYGSSEKVSIAYDTLKFINVKEHLTKQATHYLKKVLPIDTTVGYVVERAIITNDDADVILYSIAVKKFVSNNKRNSLPCEGCQAIEDNRIFVSGNRAIFEIDRDSNLKFKNWME